MRGISIEWTYSNPAAMDVIRGKFGMNYKNALGQSSMYKRVVHRGI